MVQKNYALTGDLMLKGLPVPHPSIRGYLIVFSNTSQLL